MMNKHAYLIIAHNEFEVLKALLQLLDYEKNDIYLHIDRKVDDFDERLYTSYVKKSHVYILKNRISVTWGDYSQIECELRLLEAAVPKNYSYYHLLSGVDLPIKPQNVIYDFFESSQMQFVHFDSEILNEFFLKRVNKYWLIKGRNKSFFQKAINRVLLTLQFPINRVKKSGLNYQKGANWFSITNGFAQYLVLNRAVIEKTFKYTLCGDEMFLQTLIMCSPYKDEIYLKKTSDDYHSIQREIDWKRGNPYVFQKEDFEYLNSSELMFARKFSWNVDSEIVCMLLEQNRIN